jgi:hypothetical protein
LAERDRQDLEAKINEPPPTEAQFDYDNDAYVQALRKHEYDKGVAEGQMSTLVSQQQAAENAKFQDSMANYNKNISEFVAEENITDFHTSIQALANLNPAVAQEIVNMGDPRISYHLSKNLDVAQQLHVASPIEAGRILNEISSKVGGSKQNNISNAGAPTQDPPPQPLKANADEFDQRFPDAEIK